MANSNTKSDYIGRISNTGSQHVQAPFPTSSKGSPSVKSGGDLRTGNPPKSKK